MSTEAVTTVSKDDDDQMFFTTSDLIQTINNVLKDNQPQPQPQVDNDKTNANENLNSNSNSNDESVGGFELQRRLPDGTTRKADEKDIAMADFQSKIKQTGDRIAKLSPQEKLEWAKGQRQSGNKLYSKKQYKEAMDVYLTCLVAIDVKNGNSDDSGNGNENDSGNGNDNDNDNQQKSPCTNSTSSAITSATTSESTNTIKIDIDKEEKNHNDNNEEEQEEQQWRKKIDDEIKLPVLMNLSACTLKLGMHRKTVSFCNMALEMESGCIHPKVYFRRGKSHMLMGLYNYARADFHQSLALLAQSNDNNDDNNNDDNGNNDDNDDNNDERKRERTRQIEAVNKELVHLKKLVESAEKNRKRHEKAMKLVLGGGSGDNNKSSISRISGNHSADNNNTTCQISPHDNDNVNHIEGSTAITAEPIGFVEANGNNDQGNHHQGSLYADVNTTREYSTLRAKPRRKKQRFATRSSLDKNDKTMTFAQQGVPSSSSSSSSSSSPTATRRYFVWYMKMIEQGLRKTLYWLGDEEAMTRSFDDDEEVKEKIM